MTLDEIISLDASDSRRTKKIKRILKKEEIDLLEFAITFTENTTKGQLEEFSQELLKNVAVKQDALVYALDTAGAFEDLLLQAQEKAEYGE